MQLSPCDRCKQEHVLELLTISSESKISELWLCEPCLNIARSMWVSFMKPQDEKMNDDSIMPFGKHKGKPLKKIPDHYWTWFLEQHWCDKWPRLVEYANVGYEE